MLTTTQAKLAARLLREAAEEYRRGDSLDFAIDDTPEHRDFAESLVAHEAPLNESLYASRDGAIILTDYCVMEYLAHLLDPDARKAGAP